MFSYDQPELDYRIILLGKDLSAISRIRQPHLMVRSHLIKKKAFLYQDTSYIPNFTQLLMVGTKLELHSFQIA